MPSITVTTDHCKRDFRKYRTAAMTGTRVKITLHGAGVVCALVSQEDLERLEKLDASGRR